MKICPSTAFIRQAIFRCFFVRFCVVDFKTENMLGKIVGLMTEANSFSPLWWYFVTIGKLLCFPSILMNFSSVKKTYLVSIHCMFLIVINYFFSWLQPQYKLLQARFYLQRITVFNTTYWCKWLLEADNLNYSGTS